MLNKLQSDLSDHKSEVHSNASKKDSALKDIHSRMVSLAELSGKLGQFIGKSDAVTEAINNAITAIIDSDPEFKSLKNPSSSTGQSPAAVSAGLINDGELDEKIEHYNNLKTSLESKKTDKNPPLSSEESRLLSSHQSKLDALQRLKSLNESLNSLSKNDNNCKNLLTNLCSGLEKFLGYQETSKGYDGTGIVYSDLDRLCDGVMSFLHGVLSGVKDDESVFTYSFISQNDLNKILEHMHLGDYGFRVCIDHVSDILSEYDKHLNEKTNAVNTSLSELSTNLSNQYVTQVNEKINEPLEKQLTAWRTTVQSLETEVNKIQTEKINVLDTTLKSSVLREFVPVKSVVEHMRSVSLDPNLMDQAKRVDGELLKTKAKLDAEIAKQSITLQQNMIVQFNRVENSILILKRNNAEHFKK
ncbi:hypothetical protein, conserved [Babesia ovata]|uniref:Uncharacterized protein n=1 Tax=Babesia ovata TaxID=189622 RepID=A0A2H6KJS6_9APIC|nr:uncharacterized protein BOVATA_047230 [Babesia ovata]GBE63230.1 hypothetical protein, conserved [Babesia ovata]